MDETTKMTADLIVYGKIYTADSKRSLAQAMAGALTSRSISCGRSPMERSYTWVTEPVQNAMQAKILRL